MRMSFGRLALVLSGSGCLAASWPEKSDAMSMGYLSAGVVLLALGAALPLIKSVSSKWFSMDFRDEVDGAEMSTALALQGEGPALGLEEAEVSEDVDERLLGAARYFAASGWFEYVLKVLGDEVGAEYRLFVLDEMQGRLLPVFEPEEGGVPSHGWEVGHGVTGVAYERGEYVCVHGRAAHDGTYGLTPDQQRRYEHLRVVAAMPVRNASGSIVAVLSGSSESPDSLLGTPDGYERHQGAALMVGRVLIDLLKWFPDSDDE